MVRRNQNPIFFFFLFLLGIVVQISGPSVSPYPFCVCPQSLEPRLTWDCYRCRLLSFCEPKFQNYVSCPPGGKKRKPFSFEKPAHSVFLFASPDETSFLVCMPELGPSRWNQFTCFVLLLFFFFLGCCKVLRPALLDLLRVSYPSN